MALFQPITGTNLGFRTDLASKVHNLSSDVIRACLATGIPATTVFTPGSTDLGNGNGYFQGGTQLNAQTLTETAVPLFTFATTNTPAGIVWTASGAGLTFRYVLIVNATAGKVLGYYDYGGSLSVPSGSTFTFTPGASHFTIT